MATKEAMDKAIAQIGQIAIDSAVTRNDVQSIKHRQESQSDDIKTLFSS